MKQPINIIFDGPPGMESGRFVEVETDDGKSINAGEWIQKDDYWVLRITELPEKFMDYEDDIEKEEQRRKHLTSSSSGRADSLPKCSCERCTGIPLESLYEDDPHAT